MPAWYSDGRHIAYASERSERCAIERILSGGDTYEDIYVIGIDGRGEVKLTQAVDRDEINDGPCWSPDGTPIAFRNNLSGDRTHVMDADDSTVIRLAIGGHAVWTPHGRRLAMASHRDGNWQIDAIAAPEKVRPKPLYYRAMYSVRRLSSTISDPTSRIKVRAGSLAQT